MMAALVKVFLLVTTSCLFASGILPPRPPVKADESAKVYKGQPLEFVVRPFAYICCCEVVLALLWNAAALAVFSGVPPVGNLSVQLLCPRNDASILYALSHLSPRFLVGAACVWAGAILRLWCFRTLGRHFTFEVVVADDQRLVISGPYAFVRHPSYTGMILLLAGVYMMEFGADGYMVRCGITAASPVGSLAYSWMVASVFVVLSLYHRCKVEDVELHSHFKDVWSRYRDSVPYRLIPLIF
ncbi:hypothetical protein C8Q79DRAFT_903887 [Trametes meyenii]|nr:hypothetical protein C8Q79DRAFT_903887 [Trametes meyenii]